MGSVHTAGTAGTGGTGATGATGGTGTSLKTNYSGFLAENSAVELQ